MNDKFYDLSEEKQNIIINAALSVFSEFSYKKASTDDIAKTANISKALIFHYFGTKKELYLFLYEYAKKFLINSMSKFHDYSETDFFKILADAQISKLKVLVVYPNIMRFLVKSYCEESDEVKPNIDTKMAELVKSTTERFYERADMSKFKEGIDVHKIINIILWMSDGYLRSRSAEEFEDLSALNDDYLSYLELLRQQTYKPEYL